MCAGGVGGVPLFFVVNINLIQFKTSEGRIFRDGQESQTRNEWLSNGNVTTTLNPSAISG